MDDCMAFPDTVEEFMEQYKVVDTEQVYTNGMEMVPIFRMSQWFEHLPSAQERKTGRWVEETGENEVLYHGHCSICGWNAVICETDVFGMPYCPNCGAKMVRGEEHENKGN